MLAKRVGLDLGHAYTRVFVKGDGLVFNQPSPENFPFKNGRIVDGDVLNRLVRELLIKTIGRQRLFKPDVLVGVISSMTDDDRRMLLASVVRAGVRTVYLLDMPMLSAMGSGLVVDRGNPILIVDIGGGKTDIAVVTLDGTLASEVIVVSSNELSLKQLVSGIKQVLEDTPANLDAQIRLGGGVLTGGGAKREGLAGQLTEELSINFQVVSPRPELAVINGCSMALDNFAGLRQNRSHLLRASRAY